MPDSFSLNIDDDVRHSIANGIFSAITSDIPEIIQDHNLPTTNGAGLFRWNYINRNVSKNLGGRFQMSYVKRGPWQLLLLYEQNIGFTFSIMTEKNLSRLHKHLPDGIHYIEPLISINKGYKVIEGQTKMDLPEPHRDPTAVERLREQLLNEFAGIIKNHILILFDYDFSRVVSARAVLLTPEFGIAYSEDWSKFLNKPYEFRKTSILEEMTANDSEELVHLKAEKSSNNIVSLPTIPEIENN